MIGDQQLLESRIAVHGFWLQHVLQGTVNKLLYTGFRKHDDPSKTEAFDALYLLPLLLTAVKTDMPEGRLQSST